MNAPMQSEDIRELAIFFSMLFIGPYILGAFVGVIIVAPWIFLGELLNHWFGWRFMLPKSYWEGKSRDKL